MRSLGYFILLSLFSVAGCALESQGALPEESIPSPPGSDASPDTTVDQGTGGSGWIDGSVEAAVDAGREARADVSVTDAPLEATSDDAIIDTTREPLADALQEPVDPCPESGSILWNGHCYFPLTPPQGMTFYEAQGECRTNHNAHLVTITSQEELAEVGRIPGQVWIGLTCPSMTGNPCQTWEWTTGEPLATQNWSPNDPDGTGYCVRRTPDNLWRDWYCDEAVYPDGSVFHAICERDP